MFGATSVCRLLVVSTSLLILSLDTFLLGEKRGSSPESEELSSPLYTVHCTLFPPVYLLSCPLCTVYCMLIPYVHLPNCPLYAVFFLPRNMVYALKELSIRGDFRTTVEFLITLLETVDFDANHFDTGWLDKLIADKVKVCVVH